MRQAGVTLIRQREEWTWLRTVPDWMWAYLAARNPPQGLQAGARQEAVLRYVYGLPRREGMEAKWPQSEGTEHSLAEAGRAFGVTRERIRQIEAKGLRELRHRNDVADRQWRRGWLC